MKKKGKMKIPPRQAKRDMVYYAMSMRERDKPMVGARILAETRRRRQEMSRAEANGKGFVKEGRLANEVEVEAIKKALAGFGEMECLSDGAILLGRDDEPYGWYLFKLPSVPVDGAQYMILGDCLDVLPDYTEMLTLQDVHEFAIVEMDGRYEAIQDWGVFRAISMPLKQMLVDMTGASEGVMEMVEWSQTKRKWYLRYSIQYKTDREGWCHSLIFIPACLSCSREADFEYAKGWREDLQKFDVDFTVENLNILGASFEDALADATAQKRKMAEIDNAIRYYLETDKTDYRKVKEAMHEQSVWVLTIMNGDNEVSPEVHSSFSGAVEGVKTDIDDCKMSQWEDIRKQLEEQMYYYDEESETTYDISLCVVGD